jgi:hypothetical protein
MRCQSKTKYRGEILQCEDKENHAACHYHLNVIWGNNAPCGICGRSHNCWNSKNFCVRGHGGDCFDPNCPMHHPKKKRLSGAQRRKHANRNAELSWKIDFGFDYP